MGYEPDYEPSTTPKLSLFSLPTKQSEPPGMLTPPLHTSASVPFQWEEAPGKPIPSTTTTTSTLSKPKAARCLDLPPRLLAEVRITNMPSPTTVLDGPYVGRSLSHTFSFKGKLGGSSFGSWRWPAGGLIKENKEVVRGSFDFSSSVTNDGFVDEAVRGGGPKVKITRSRRRGSFLSVSHTRSHLWASIYEGFKQVVPWRRRQENLRKMGS